MEAPLTVTTQPTPQKVQIVGILMIVSAAFNIIIGLGFIVGFALSIILICCAPIGLLPLALGVFEVIYGIRLIGSGQEPVQRQTLQTIAILEIASILVSNVGSFIAGVVNLLLLSDPEVMAYYSK
jgi:hypothetical protein